MSSKKIDIRSLKKNELIKFLNDFNYEPYRAQQILSRVNSQQIDSFEKITNIPKDLIQLLDENFFLSNTLIHQFQKSSDLTIKFSIKLHDNLIIEAVLIPTEKRITACVSSQVGCSLDCNFCATSRLKRIRNLESYEIYDQIMLLNNESLKSFSKPISNIVFMGMGEPLYNYENVKNAAEIMGDKEGIQLSTKRITLSTSGIVPEIIKWGNEVDSRLAISLHATNDELRNDIVPINKKFPLKELIKACREYPRSKNSKRITFEYVMLKGVNDTAQDARKLVKLISGIPAKINLIPFNPWPNSPYECSSKEEIKKFSDIIKNAGYASPVRKTRGQDIMAACGQLKSSSIKIRKSELRANG